ncbi:MAG: hypothetical protein EA390_01500 [Balneolaceae bacterium]|nr:MAG: hypothetical protein EA390_01500 [Balneolaceae bacterium]
MQKLKLSTWIRYMTAAIFMFMVYIPMAEAQVEDTTRVERKIPERIESQRHNTIIHTPYNMNVLSPGMNQYRLNDQGTTYGFYRRLNYQGAQEFIMTEDTGYDPYGPEWERKLNADLIAILQATFKEQSSILQTLARIAPFLGFGWNRYEPPPPPRIEHPDSEPVEY